MPNKNPDAKLRALPNERRKLYGCRLNESIFEKFIKEVDRLNCSQAVYLEILLIKALEVNLVTLDDVFEYDALERSFGRMNSIDFVGLVQQGKAQYYKKLSIQKISLNEFYVSPFGNSVKFKI